MSTITTVPAASLDSVIAPWLAKMAARLAGPAAKQAEVLRTSGLSIADISDASMRATAKGGLTTYIRTATRMQRCYACAG